MFNIKNIYYNLVRIHKDTSYHWESLQLAESTADCYRPSEMKYLYESLHFMHSSCAQTLSCSCTASEPKIHVPPFDTIQST